VRILFANRLCSSPIFAHSLISRTSVGVTIKMRPDRKWTELNYHLVAFDLLRGVLLSSPLARPRVLQRCPCPSHSPLDLFLCEVGHAGARCPKVAEEGRMEIKAWCSICALVRVTRQCKTSRERAYAAVFCFFCCYCCCCCCCCCCCLCGFPAAYRAQRSKTCSFGSLPCPDGRLCNAVQGSLSIYL
jgi:hypothetical protein